MTTVHNTASFYTAGTEVNLPVSRYMYAKLHIRADWTGSVFMVDWF
jgi:hypothetical protein